LKAGALRLRVIGVLKRFELVRGDIHWLKGKALTVSPQLMPSQFPIKTIGN
jgi:hypothetical protein